MARASASWSRANRPLAGRESRPGHAMARTDSANDDALGHISHVPELQTVRGHDRRPAGSLLGKDQGAVAREDRAPAGRRQQQDEPYER